MSERAIERCGAWSIGTTPSRCGGFVAWAKMGPIQGRGPLDEPGEHVWFEFGKTRHEAACKLKAELGCL